MPHPRAQNVNNSHASNPSKSHNTRAQAQSAISQNSVRRNPFHQHLNQRPGTTKPSPEIVSEPERPTSATVFGVTTAEASASPTASSPLDSREIVPRDQNGNYKLDIPALPPVMLEDESDESPMDGMEDGQPGSGSGNTGMANSGMDGELGSRDKESMRHSLNPLPAACEKRC